MVKTRKIPKARGGYREIVVPSPRHKRSCRNLIPKIQQLMLMVSDLEAVHGFMPMRNAVTNALPHVGYEWTVSFDLDNFFDHVRPQCVSNGVIAAVDPSSFAYEFPRKAGDNACQTPEMLARAIAAKGLVVDLWQRHRRHVLYVNGRAKQGLPTSPLLANIAAAAIDARMARAIDMIKEGCHCPDERNIVYTRYADDLTFSTDCKDCVQELRKSVPEILERVGFPINQKKTRVQWARFGRRIITGVAVDKDGIYPTRKLRRKIRAARHNLAVGKLTHFPVKQWVGYKKHCARKGKTPLPKEVWLQRWLERRLQGLEEWAALKVPSKATKARNRLIAAKLPPKELLEALASIPKSKSREQ